MEYINHLLLGFGITFLPVAIPGMINMTGVGVSIRRGPRAGLLFAMGASVALYIQAFVATTFSGYLSTHPEVMNFLRKAAVAIFLLLGFVFLFQALRAKVVRGAESSGKAQVFGFVIAAMNPLKIPYFFTVGTFLEAHGLLAPTLPNRTFFATGVMLGAAAVLSLYAHFSRFIQEHANYLARNINYFLSGLCLFLAFVQLMQLYAE